MQERKNRIEKIQELGRLAILGVTLACAAQAGKLAHEDFGDEDPQESVSRTVPLEENEQFSGINFLNINALTRSSTTPTQTATPTSTETPTIVPAATQTPTIETSQNQPDSSLNTHNPELSTQYSELPPEARLAKGGIAQYLQELPQIIDKIEASPQIFNQESDIEDLKIYYPIYRTAQDKFNVPWQAVWILHQEESTVSRNPKAFVVDEFGQYGAGQRDTDLHHEENVAYASRGLEFLSNLPQRHWDDWRELSWMAMKLKEDTDTKGSLYGAFERYTLGSGNRRMQKFLTLEAVFGNR